MNSKFNNENNNDNCLKEIRELKREIKQLRGDINNLASHYYNDTNNTNNEDLIPINDTKSKMIARLFLNMLSHPKRAYKLVTKIKKGNMHFGDHHADICFLKYGEVNIIKEEKPVVSIIIPVYNQYIYTYKCLLSIAKYTDIPFEVIIGDDLSTDGTKYLGDYVDNIIINKNSNNLRFLKNCNNAAKRARGKYILFLNNDTQVTKNWLSSLVDLIESDKTIGMVGSKLVFPNGMLQEAGGIIFNDGSACNYGKFDDPSKPQYNYVRDVDYISGASIMISKKLWDEIGGFDVNFAPAYCEDSDLAFEVRKKGYRVVYQPKSVVVHFEGISNGTDTGNTSSLKHYQIKNTIRLKEKWNNELKNHPSKDTNILNFSFRDRIYDKNVVLVVDHFVPEYDKDAGSKTTYQYLKMFVEKGYIVKFLPDNYNNSQPYTSTLEQLGIEVLYGSDYAKNIEKWIIENNDNIDVVYLNRPHISMKYIDFFKTKTTIKIIYYGHDLHFLREQREYEITKKEEHIENSKYWKNIELDIMRKSDQVYYPSYIEKDLINKVDPNINVKAISAYIFDDVDTNTKFNFDDKKGIMFVGGFNHRPNVDAVLWFIKEVYPKLNNIPFYIVGSNAPKEITNLKSINGVIFKGYVSDEELKELYANVRVVVVPLRYGAGIKGKVVEAMANGIPFVTTSTGAEGINGIEEIVPVKDDANEFAKSLVELYNNSNKLSDVSLMERIYIKNNFSTSSAWNIVKDDFVHKYSNLLIAPNGYGNKDDEASINIALDFFGRKSTKIITPSKNLWTKNSDIINVSEEYVPISEFDKLYNNEKLCIILGNNYIDGTNGMDEALTRLNLAKKTAENGGKSIIFCSFNNEVDNEILRAIKKLPSNVYFYLNDELSYKNFINTTRKKCNYIPNLTFFTNDISDEKTEKINEDLSKLKIDYNLIGLNISEELYNTFNKEKYIKKIVDLVIKNVKNPYFVVYSNNDIEYKYALEVKNYLNDLNNSNCLVLDKDIDYSKISFLMNNLETIICSNISMVIAAFKSRVIPISYVTENDKGVFDAIYESIIGTSKYVIDDINDLQNAISELENNYFNQLDYLKQIDKLNKYISEVCSDFIDEIRILNKGEIKNDNNKDTF